MALADSSGGDGSSSSPRDTTQEVQKEQRDADSNSQRSAPKGKEATKETPRHDQQQQQQLLVAGLHRDGEQARIVEVIRRRQVQQYNEKYTFQYMWGSVLYYSGFADEHPSSTHHQFNDTQLLEDDGEAKNKLQPDNATDEQKTTSTIQPIVDEEPLREKAFAEQQLAKRPYVVRLAFIFYRRLHLMLRWFIDSCITRLSRLESLPRSPTMYATTPTYSLQLQADDVICFIAVLWMSLWISSRTSHVLAVAIMMSCIVMGSVGTRVVGRIRPAATRQFQLQSHYRDSTSSASTQALIPPALTPKQSTTTDQKEGSSSSIERLQKRHPNATKAECIRFFRCAKQNEKAASARIEEWFAWRLENGLKISIDEAAGEGDTVEETIPYGRDYMKKDEKLWNETAKLAIEIVSKSSGSNNGTENNVQLPQIICSYEMRQTSDALSDNDNNVDDEVTSTTKPPRCKDGSRIFHLVPARFDLSIATAQVYALAAALYLDRLLSRCTTEKVSLICDVRGGRGWANPTPWSLLPFVQATSSLLGRHFPERLKRMVLYPMPSSAVWVWAAAQKFLDADTASKVVVVGLDGTSPNNNNDLHEELEKFITRKDYLLLEERRKTFFAPKNS
jgi:hypothetical protein